MGGRVRNKAVIGPRPHEAPRASSTPWRSWSLSRGARVTASPHHLPVAEATLGPSGRAGFAAAATDGREESAASPLLFIRPDHCAAIDLVSRDERDLSGCLGRRDVGVGRELARRDTVVENNLHLLPERIEAVALDGVEDAHEHQARLASVAHVDGVDGVVVPECRDLGVRRQLREVDREQVPVVIRGHGPNAMVVLKEMFKHAVQWGYLDANPAQYAERPRAEDQEMQILTPPEIRRLLDAADEPVRTLLLCAVLTGMRRGELLGLRWEDIDLEGHRLFVRRALWRGKFVTPKSRRSRRTIDLAPTLRAALAKVPSRFQAGLVFCSPDGEPINPDTFAQQDWTRALRRAELRRIRFHDLRHTYASLLIAQGRTRSTSRCNSATPR